MNLHEWITSRVDAIESLANEVKGGMWAAAEGPGGTAETVLRRCEADRRILARHTLAGPGHWMYPGCAGCGTEGEFDDPVTDNLNDCPELLDLAHAHGITPEELAALDPPQKAPRRAAPPDGQRWLNEYAALLNEPDRPVRPRMTAEQVPATFKGRIVVVHERSSASRGAMAEAIREAIRRASQFGARR